jgi:hypothetical protein
MSDLWQVGYVYASLVIVAVVLTIIMHDWKEPHD